MKIKNIASPETKIPYSLSYADNYNKMLNNSIKEVLEKYILLVNDYMILISEKIYIKKTNYYKYIFIRGLDTITSVFKFILFYTKNVDLTYYHSQKAFYFFVEFIEQISNDQNTFLQLSSREACMFVYKKTIYEIVYDYKKINKLNQKEETEAFEIINNYLVSYKNIIMFCINSIHFTYENKIDYIHEFSKKLKTYSEIVNNNLLCKDKLYCYDEFINHITNKNISIEQLFCLSKLFIEKIVTKKITDYSKFKIELIVKIYFEDYNSKDNIILVNQIFNGSNF